MLKRRHARQKPAQSTLTLDRFFEEHYLPHISTRNRDWITTKNRYNHRIKPNFGSTAVEAITRQQVQAFHDALRSEDLAPATCDHSIKLIRHMLNMAVDWEMLEKNPAAKIKLFNADNKVEHYLNDEELGRLLKVLHSHENRIVANIALFLLSTGARLQEALKAEWKHIDRKNRVWTVPSSTSKSKRVHAIPLNDSALSVLDSLDTAEAYDHLFINKRTGKRYTTIAKTWGHIREAAGLPHLRIHDLRHTAASLMSNAGHTLYEIQQVLGHSDPKVTQRYAHLSTETLQKASNSVSESLQRAMERN